MRIIISPAKNMKSDPGAIGLPMAPEAPESPGDSAPCRCGCETVAACSSDDGEPRSARSREVLTVPAFIHRTEELLQRIRGLSFEECKALWGCSDKLTRLNYERFADMDLWRNLTPALFCYEGIQYRYMAPNALEGPALIRLQEQLRILSGFYGALRPFDGIVPYRLEMQSPLTVGEKRDLYDFWGRALYERVRDDSGIIINLASGEYSRCIERYLQPGDRMITAVFGELVRGKVAQKGTYAKMARGEMVRFLAERQAEDPEAMKDYGGLGFAYRADLSDENTYVFLRQGSKETKEEA